MPRLVQLWRHPIKSHGREALERVTLAAGRTMPWDRTWAVAHDAAHTDGTAWAPCANFSRGAKAPGLMGISAQLEEASETLTLRHPDLPDLRFRPDAEPQALIDWTRPLMPEGRAASARVVRVPDRGMTDTDYPSIALINLTSHRAVEQQLQTPLSPIRWRANLWLDDGMPAWSEFDLVGRTLRIGTAALIVREPITRCLATSANPDTGKRDADTLGALDTGFGHQEFGVYAEVVKGGEISVGARVEVL